MNISTIAGELSFNYGWERKIEIDFNHKKTEINLFFVAYYKNELLTQKQELAYQFWKSNKFQIEGNINSILNQSQYNIDFVVPTCLYFDKAGSIFLLCDEINDMDDGIAIDITDSYKILSQDVVL